MTDAKSDPVSQWLVKLGVGQYANSMQEEGFDSLLALRHIREVDLEALGVKRGHRALILAEAALLANTVGSPTASTAAAASAPASTAPALKRVLSPSTLRPGFGLSNDLPLSRSASPAPASANSSPQLSPRGSPAHSPRDAQHGLLQLPSAAGTTAPHHGSLKSHRVPRANRALSVPSIPVAALRAAGVLEDDCSDKPDVAKRELELANAAAVRGNWADAFPHWRKAMEAGSDEALFRVAFCYLHGMRAVPIDSKRAVALLKQAVERKVAGAAAVLAECFYSGHGVAKDEKEGARLLALEADNPHAKWYNAFLSKEALVRQRGFDGSLPALTELAARGDPEAQCKLGITYCFGLGVAKDVSKAEAWFLKSAQQGHAAAQDCLAVAYEDNGQGEKALQWFLEAARQNNPMAQYSLGVCYQDGHLGVSIDLDKSRELFERAAKQGHKLARHKLKRHFSAGDSSAAAPATAASASASPS